MAETQPEPLSPDDAAILALESAAIAGHTMKLIVLEPAPQPLELARLRASVAARLEAEPRARQRVELAEGAAEGARWVEDRDFDLAAHVRARGGTEGLDEAGMWRVAGEIMSERLDHARPLWSFDLLGPFADGREALAVRIHHAMADGISCVRFVDALLWDRAAGSDPTPGTARAGGGADAAGRSRVAEARRFPGALGRELGGHAGRSALDRPIGSARELAFASFPLGEMKRIGASRPAHATVNDVLLAGVAGGLREWLARGDEALPRLRAQVPVSLHHRDESADELGNRDSFLNVDLPLSEPDPLGRLDLINAETAKRKRLGDPEELYDFFHALARFRHLGRAVERVAGGPREFSLSISNVPGPRTAVSVAGHSAELLCSVAEPADRHALRVSAISCAGALGVGLCTDPGALSGVAELGRAIDAAFSELHALAMK